MASGCVCPQLNNRMSDSPSSSDSDLFPDTEYRETVPIKAEIAEIGTKPVEEVLGQLRAEVEKERVKAKPLPSVRVSIDDKLRSIRDEEQAEASFFRHKQPRGKDDPSLSPFKRPKPPSAK